jgi:hypothetical protein
MLDHSNLEQLRRIVRSSLQNGVFTKKGAVWFMEVIDHYEQAIRPEPVQEPKTGDKRPGPKVNRGPSDRSRGASRNRGASVRS